MLVGKPVIRGTRISAELILDWLLEDMDLVEFFASYPRLTLEDVQTAIAFARDAVRQDCLRSRHRKEAVAAARKRADLALVEV